jgi:hypothetical protein
METFNVAKVSKEKYFCFIWVVVTPSRFKQENNAEWLFNFALIYCIHGSTTVLRKT